MLEKEIILVFYGRRFPRSDWMWDVEEDRLSAFLNDIEQEFAPLGVVVTRREEPETMIDVKGYGDLLNTVRLRSPKDGIGNLCLGHIIGVSARRDFFEDIRRGINRVAFAPETIEPEGSDKIVCHNCGCGC